MKKFITLLLSISMLLVMFSTLCYAKEFSDVDSSHWALSYISKLSDDGVINGYDDGTFKPNKTITRAEFIKLIVTESLLSGPRTAKLKTAAPTLYGDWWKSYAIMAEKYIPYTYTDEDYPNPITRLEVANILNSFAIKDKFYKVDEDGKANIGDSGDVTSSFNDTNGIGDSNEIILSNISKIGLLIGYDDGSFKPGKPMTRAEIATIIYRYHNIRGEENV